MICIGGGGVGRRRWKAFEITGGAGHSQLHADKKIMTDSDFERFHIIDSLLKYNIQPISCPLAFHILLHTSLLVLGRQISLLGLPWQRVTDWVVSTTEMHFLQFWRLAVWDQVVARIDPFWGFSPLLAGSHLLTMSLHGLPSVCVCLLMSSYKDASLDQCLPYWTHLT